MRLKVKLLFMIAAGLLFFGGPMLGSAFANTATLEVTPGSATNLSSSCTEDGAPGYEFVKYANTKPEYNLVYNFTVSAGATTCRATLPLPVELSASSFSSSDHFVFGLQSDSPATWSSQDIDLKPGQGNSRLHINFDATGLQGDQEYTYKPFIGAGVCQGCNVTPTILIQQNADSRDTYLTGKVVVHIYADGHDYLYIYSGTSLGSGSTPLSCSDNGTSVIGGGNTPALVPAAGASYQYVYHYTINAGDTVCDAVPINLHIYNTDSTGDGPGNPLHQLEVTCDSTLSSTVNNNSFCGSSYADVSDPAPTLADGSRMTDYVYFDSGPLNVAGTYDFFFQVKDVAAGSDKPTVLDCVGSVCAGTRFSDGYIHIQIKVSSTTQAFFTDGNFAGLLNCAGDPVKLSDGGTFDIVPGGKGKSTIESTNPGEFFYNLIWTNTTGSPTTINFTVPTFYNVTSKGAESVHAYAFNPSDPGGFDESVSSFDQVLGYGTPCTDPTSNTCTIQNVPAGYIVWIVWHVTYNQIGGSTAGLPKFAGVCPVLTNPPTGTSDAKNNIYANGQITYTGLGTPITSSASAWGYLKH